MGRNTITFIAWSPDDAGVFVGSFFFGCPYLCSQVVVLTELLQPKMTYASSREALKLALVGLAADVQINSDDELEYDTILKEVSRNKR